MASVRALVEVGAARDRGLLPSVRPVTTLLATGIVWITVLLSVCGFAAGYLRQQALNTTTGELERLDTIVAAAAGRSSPGIDGMAANLAAMFVGMPLPEDTVITLLDGDGHVLARYPGQPDRAESGIAADDLRAIFAGSGVTTLRQTGSDQQEWRIEAIRPLPGHPFAVSVSRGAAAALANWKRQVIVIGIVAVGGAFGIALMMYLIARQIHAHDELVSARADKLEAERARLEAETKLLKVQRLAVLGQVTGAVAHELHAPLIAIRETLAALKEIVADSGSDLEKPVARMERSIERCERMSSDLLEYTSARELQPTSVGFDQWLGEVIAKQDISGPVKLSTELRAGNVVASFDPERIRRVLADLVENACQAVSELPSYYERRVVVRTGIAPGMVVLTVADTGPGIAPENLERIFDPLFSTKSFGTGLGLPIVKQIVEQHGGTIRIDSEVAHGTRVRICLPLAADALPELRRAAA
jgi:signal transduction histidine kinase